jgi:formylglycine-generating enzyme required for sulfatase activity
VATIRYRPDHTGALTEAEWEYAARRGLPESRQRKKKRPTKASILNTKVTGHAGGVRQSSVAVATKREDHRLPGSSLEDQHRRLGRERWRPVQFERVQLRDQDQ